MNRKTMAWTAAGIVFAVLFVAMLAHAQQLVTDQEAGQISQQQSSQLTGGKIWNAIKEGASKSATRIVNFVPFSGSIARFSDSIFAPFKFLLGWIPGSKYLFQAAVTLLFVRLLIIFVDVFVGFNTVAVFIADWKKPLPTDHIYPLQWELFKDKLTKIQGIGHLMHSAITGLTTLFTFVRENIISKLVGLLDKFLGWIRDPKIPLLKTPIKFLKVIITLIILIVVYVNHTGSVNVNSFGEMIKMLFSGGDLAGRAYDAFIYTPLRTAPFIDTLWIISFFFYGGLFAGIFVLSVTIKVISFLLPILSWRALFIIPGILAGWFMLDGIVWFFASVLLFAIRGDSRAQLKKSIGGFLTRQDKRKKARKAEDQAKIDAARKELEQLNDKVAKVYATVLALAMQGKLDQNPQTKEDYNSAVKQFTNRLHQIGYAPAAQAQVIAAIALLTKEHEMWQVNK